MLRSWHDAHLPRRTERDAGLEPQGDGVHRFKAPAAREHREREDGFRPRERFADALPRAAAEGEVGPPRAGTVSFGRKTLRVETLGIRPPSWVAVRDPLADEDHRAALQAHAPDFHRLLRL